MADYKASDVVGNKWQRCWRIVVDNPLNGSPSINYIEEEAVAIGEETIRKDVGNLVEEFDPEKVIELRDPATGELTGQSITHGEMYVAMYSAYMAAALARDAPDETAA